MHVYVAAGRQKGGTDTSRGCARVRGCVPAGENRSVAAAEKPPGCCSAPGSGCATATTAPPAGGCNSSDAPAPPQGQPGSPGPPQPETSPGGGEPPVSHTSHHIEKEGERDGERATESISSLAFCFFILRGKNNVSNKRNHK